MIGLDHGAAEAFGDLLLLLEGLLGDGAVWVELSEAGEEDEAAEGGARCVEDKLLDKPRLRRPHLCFLSLSLRRSSARQRGSSAEDGEKKGEEGYSLLFAFFFFLISFSP